MEKKIFTREEFDQMRAKSAEEMAADGDLIQKARDLKVRAGHEYFWVHQTNWLGEPVLQLTQDLFAIQEIIFKSRPDVIIESGVCWGGGLLFYSTLMEVLGGREIIGIDVFMPEDMRKRVLSWGRLSERITLVEGSSTGDEVVERVRGRIQRDDRVMVILDSLHTHEHVLNELRAYAPLVKKGQYLVCGDTAIEYQPAAEKRPRPWGKGNNPKTALDAYLRDCPRFGVDLEIQNKLLMSNCPGGYLKCIRD